MSIEQRNHVRVSGQGQATLFLAHGFGCDQSVWRLLEPTYRECFRVVTFDHVGAGNSDLTAYDAKKYAALNGYAQDVLEIVEAFASGPSIYVGHSVGASIGVIAHALQPGAFTAHVMVAPSPRYLDDGDYVGGFSREDVDSMLQAIDADYLGWAGNMAPIIMGAPEQPGLGAELTKLFCRMDPTIAKQFARATFLSDVRAKLAHVDVPTLVLQCSDDIVAPVTVGKFMNDALPRSTVGMIDNVGHCPHLSAPRQTIAAMDAFFDHAFA